MSAQGWANEIVLPQYSSISHDQAWQIYHELGVWRTTPGIRPSQAKKLNVDPNSKTLSMQGNSAHFNAALFKALSFIQQNGATGVAKPFVIQELWCQSQREKAAERKAERQLAHEQLMATQQQRTYIIIFIFEYTV